MAPMLSAKGVDITTWRATQDFAAAYRQALLNQASSSSCDNAESIFSAAYGTLETSLKTHKELSGHLNKLIDEVTAETAPARLKELTRAFYSDLYSHFGYFRSSLAFYQLSMEFLRKTGAAIIARAKCKLGPVSESLPEIALIAVGPAGRCEYSPFCPLQILIVHGDATAVQQQSIIKFCQILHAGFEGAGVAVDPVITPRNIRWRGSMTEWQQRCEEGLYNQANDKLIDLYRLIDQYPLYPAEGLSTALKNSASSLLNGSRPAVANMVVRMTSLSNGIGIMGRLKLERSGTGRGMFNLLDHGLLPFSAALSLLSLINGSDAVSNFKRIHDYLKLGHIDVELAERMLATWHSLNDLRLDRERSYQVDSGTSQMLYLSPDEMSSEQLHLLKRTLESVAIIQHHAVITFSGMEG